MRYYGTITRWNDSRKFGAIREESMGAEVFAPLSAFTSLPRPPAEGQRVSFDIVKGRRGRDEAENICFALDCADQSDFFAPPPRHYKQALAKLAAFTAAAALVSAGAWFGWGQWQQYREKVQQERAASSAAVVSDVAEKIKSERQAWRDAAKKRTPAKQPQHSQ